VTLDPTRLREAALAAAARGWHVFPLRPDDRPGHPDHAKRPAFPDHAADSCTGRDPRCRAGHTGWEPRATTDSDRIGRAWRSTPYGVGIACGPSGIVVLDLDTGKPGHSMPPEWTAERVCDGADVLAVLAGRAGQPFPATHTVTTGRGGLHLYFRHPVGTPLPNTQGERGGPRPADRHPRARRLRGRRREHGRRPRLPHAVRHGTGRAARLARRTAPAHDRAPGRADGGRPAAGSDRRVPAAALENTAARLAQAREGGRNHALFMAAQTLGQLVAGGALTEHTVTDVLTDTARGIGLSEREIARTIRSGLAAGARRPRVAA
jgi:Bifunctional DNA primase/polymerase, N-terminal